MNCGVEVLLKDLRKHVRTCGKDGLLDDIFSTYESEYGSDDDVLSLSPFAAATKAAAEVTDHPDSVMEHSQHNTESSTPPVTLNEQQYHTEHVENNLVSEPGFHSDTESDLRSSTSPQEPLESQLIEILPLKQDNVDVKIKRLVSKLREEGYDQNPVEIVRMLQQGLVTGRCLEVTDMSAENTGPTNFIIVNRNDLLKTGFEELSSIENKFLTLEVQFYGEV